MAWEMPGGGNPSAPRARPSLRLGALMMVNAMFSCLSAISALQAKRG